MSEQHWITSVVKHTTSSAASSQKNFMDSWSPVRFLRPLNDAVDTRTAVWGAQPVEEERVRIIFNWGEGSPRDSVVNTPLRRAAHFLIELLPESELEDAARLLWNNVEYHYRAKMLPAASLMHEHRRQVPIASTVIAPQLRIDD
jgi:hypothetical protein